MGTKYLYVLDTMYPDEPYLDESIPFDDEADALREYEEYTHARITRVPVGEGNSANSSAEFAKTVASGCILYLKNVEILHGKGELSEAPDWFLRKKSEESAQVEETLPSTSIYNVNASGFSVKTVLCDKCYSEIMAVAASKPGCSTIDWLFYAEEQSCVQCTINRGDG